MYGFEAAYRNRGKRLTLLFAAENLREAKKEAKGFFRGLGFRLTAGSTITIKKVKEGNVPAGLHR